MRHNGWLEVALYEGVAFLVPLLVSILLGRQVANAFEDDGTLPLGLLQLIPMLLGLLLPFVLMNQVFAMFRRIAAAVCNEKDTSMTETVQIYGISKFNYW